MGTKPVISAEKRTQIVCLSTLKLSEREISKQMKVSKTAVNNAIKKFQNEGTFKDSKRSGCPRISSIRDNRVIRKVVSQFLLKKYRLEWQKEVLYCNEHLLSK